MRNYLFILLLTLTACAQTQANKPAEPIKKEAPGRGDVMCPQDAKQCADGTWVGRSPPNCAFICSNGDDATK